MFHLAFDSLVKATTFGSIDKVNYVASASRDGKVKLWKLNGSLSLELVGEHAEHGAFVNSVALSSSGEGTLHVASGGTDGIIYLYDFMKNELIRTLIGHSGNVCCLIFTPRGKLLSCSWDKTAKLWENASIIFSLEGHEQAVWGACVVNDSVFLTASADKTIRLWEDGVCKKCYSGHNDVVRVITLLDDFFADFGDFVSTGNDGTTEAHSSFIYAMKIHKGHLFTAGEDRVIKIWRVSGGKLYCAQTIPIPAISIWSLEVTFDGDIICGASDGRIYIFTPRDDVFADERTLEDYQNRLRKMQTNKEILDTKTAEGSETLTRQGTQAGETVLIKGEHGTEWDGNKWDKIGDVVDGPAATGKVSYRGQEYDYVFDVELESGGPPLKLPFNNNENPYQAATQFLATNNLGGELVDQVVDFILKNTSAKVISSHVEKFNPYEISPPSQSVTKVFKPNVQLYTDANIEGIMKKLVEFNSMENTKLSDGEIECMQAELKARSKFSDKLMPVLIRVIEHWSPSHLFPGILQAASYAVVFDGLRVIFLKQRGAIGQFMDVILDRIRSLDNHPGSLLTAARLMVNILAFGDCFDKIERDFDAVIKMLQDCYAVGVKDYLVPANLILGLLTDRTYKCPNEIGKSLHAVLLARLRVTLDNVELAILISAVKKLVPYLNTRQKSVMASELELINQKAGTPDVLANLECAKKLLICQ